MVEQQPDIRGQLLDGALRFVRSVAQLAGIRGVALIGSVVTEKRDPKDIDLLVTVEDSTDLEPLAACCRRLLGHAQSMGRGVDVFLVNERGHYLGRTCLWRECHPGVRASCDALHCGRRRYLHDDLATIRLSDRVIASAPVQLWPVVNRRCKVPTDVERFLLKLGQFATTNPVSSKPESEG